MQLSYMRNLIVIPEVAFDEIEETLIDIRKRVRRTAHALEKNEPWKVKEMIQEINEADEMIVKILNDWDKPND